MKIRNIQNVIATVMPNTNYATHTHVDIQEEILFFPKIKWKNFVFILIFIVSILGIVFIKNVNRKLFIDTQQLQKKYHNLKTEEMKLLVMYENFISQNCIDSFAKEAGMHVPTKKDVIVMNYRE